MVRNHPERNISKRRSNHGLKTSSFLEEDHIPSKALCQYEMDTLLDLPPSERMRILIAMANSLSLDWDDENPQPSSYVPQALTPPNTSRTPRAPAPPNTNQRLRNPASPSASRNSQAHHSPNTGYIPKAPTFPNTNQITFTPHRRWIKSQTVPRKRGTFSDWQIPEQFIFESFAEMGLLEPNEKWKEVHYAPNNWERSEYCRHHQFCAHDTVDCLFLKARVRDRWNLKMQRSVGENSSEDEQEFQEEPFYYDTPSYLEF